MLLFTVFVWDGDREESRESAGDQQRELVECSRAANKDQSTYAGKIVCNSFYIL